jgi:hypothetical protein
LRLVVEKSTTMSQPPNPRLSTPKRSLNTSRRPNKNHIPKRVGSTPRKRQPHSRHSKKPQATIACLFCRSRKIACGQPLPSSKGLSCR